MSITKKIQYHPKQIKNHTYYQYELTFTKDDAKILDLQPESIVYISISPIQPLNTNHPSPSKDDNIFRAAFQELYQLFNEFAKTPNLDTATKLFKNANLELIDKAKKELSE